MSGRSLLAFLLALILAMAGCTSSDEPNTSPDGEDPDDTPEDPSDADPDQEDPSDPNPDPVSNLTNSPPSASLEATYSPGVIPQDIIFEFSGADQNGDALSWTLDTTDDGVPDAEGTALPGNYTHTFEAAGEYLVSFTVSDGTASTTEELTVTLIEGSTDDEPPVVQDISESWQGTSTNCGGPYQTWPFGTPTAGITHVEVEIDEDTIGQQFHAELESDAALFVDWEFYDEAGALLPGGDYLIASSGTVSGVVPVGAYWGLAQDCGGAGGNVHYFTTGSAP